jgi:serine/threonine protein kinase
MGVVFKARDPFIGRPVAVKTITTGIAENPDLLERFRREAQAAGGLQHPNVVTIYEMSEFEGTPFIAMEYLEGESLEKTIDRQLRIPLVQKLGYLVQACRALDYAHRRGVIHRDIKPANIMVTGEGVVKVVDFGIARIVDTSKTQTGILLGTLSYMSPEQVRGQHADQRCDVWALGVVMYELFTYRRPFDGANHAAVLMSILHDEPRAIREFIPECPPALEEVMHRALRKDEAQRYPTMEALLVDLEPIWSSLQKDAVQKLVSYGRELMDGGKLEEASEVLRKSLSIDTGNLTAKALFDQVNALLGPDHITLQERKLNTGDQNRAPAAVSVAGTGHAEHDLGGTVALAPPFDPMMTRVMEPGTERPNSSNPSASLPEQPAPSRGGQARRTGETILASLPTQAIRTDRPAPVAAGQRPMAAKTAPPRRATPQSPAAYSRPSAAPQTAGESKKRIFFYVTAGVVALVLLGVAGRWKKSARRNPAEQPAVNLPAPASAPATVAARPVAPPVATEAAPTAEAPAAVPSVSIEDQQRHLIDLAHEAADSRNYKMAQARLDEAAKLNGPLNGLIKDLHRTFSDEAHGAELRQAAKQEQSLWERAVKKIDAGSFDDADKLFRQILTLPEAGHHWADAARYVDEEIPERRHENQLWASAQLESEEKGPEHRMNEMRLLDQVLAEGGAHRQEARQRRDFWMSQFVQNNRRKNNLQGPGISPAEQAQFSQLEDAVDQAVTHRDANALQQLQGLRPRFKSIVDGGGLLVFDARDYLNNVIPRAQKAIEDRLAKSETDATANAKYRQAVEDFDQAAATENIKMLRSRVQSEFQEIAQSGGPRTEEAERYVSVLIPATLKKTAR